MTFLAHKGGEERALSVMVILVSSLRRDVLMRYSMLNVLHRKHEHLEECDTFM